MFNEELTPFQIKIGSISIFKYWWECILEFIDFCDKDECMIRYNAIVKNIYKSRGSI